MPTGRPPAACHATIVTLQRAPLGTHPTSTLPPGLVRLVPAHVMLHTPCCTAFVLIFTCEILHKCSMILSLWDIAYIRHIAVSAALLCDCSFLA